ncbi:unnamed protein product [Blepharisma stoltei]|uniref:Uncharacterized protein n=1 Tax=Blepharisma stoltei TaxID=1481888 RepID=A0AAU9IB96_9CILI|nr:unnamed protein product [Blepharisma stoltei]
MGCGSGSITTKLPERNKEQTEFTYTVKIMSPQGDKGWQFDYKSDYTEIPLPTLMNYLSYNDHPSSSLSANFISKYNQENDRFEYYVQQLMGFEIENADEPKKGKLWVVYINESKCDWDNICEKEVAVKHSDEVVWYLQKYNEIKKQKQS